MQSFPDLKHSLNRSFTGCDGYRVTHQYEQVSSLRFNKQTHFEIKPLDLNDDSLLQRALEVHEQAFPGSPGLERQLRHNTRDAPKGTVFFGAFDGNRLVGLNGFIRHSIIMENRRLGAYQSCSTATDPAYRGRGIFSSIVRHAQRALAAEGLFICGFPNDNSGPIFTGQLGFQQIHLVRLAIPGVLMESLCSHLTKQAAVLRPRQTRPTTFFDQAELIEWKRSPSGKSISVHSFSGVTIWGCEYRKIVAGMKISAFAVGGIGIGENKSSIAIVKDPSYFHRPFYYSIVTAFDSPVVQAVRHRSVRNDSGIFIYYPMQPLGDHPQFEVSGGLADFY